MLGPDKSMGSPRHLFSTPLLPPPPTPPIRDSKNATPNTSRAARITQPEPGMGKKKCVVALDIGTDASNLIITDGARIIWQRPIPVGGNHFTRALTKELKLTFAKAEHLKRNAAKSPELANILKALRPVLQEFVQEVQRSLGYFTNTHRDAQVEYMVGLSSAFKLPGLQSSPTSLSPQAGQAPPARESSLTLRRQGEHPRSWSPTAGPALASPG